MVKTIYFDLGNVLCFFNHIKMFEQLSICCGLTVEQIKAALIDNKLQQNYEQGKIATQTFYETIKNQSKKPFSLSEFTHALSDIFLPNQEIYPVIEQLKQKGFRLILLSNTCESHYTWIYTHYPVMQLFDHQILSYKEGLLKPDPKIFIQALQSAQCKPSECFYTDDIPAFVEGARSVGLDSEIFTNVPSLRRHLRQRNILIDSI